MADVQLKDFDAITTHTGLANDDYVYTHDTSDDLEKKALLSALKAFILGNKTVGGTGAGDIADNDSVQTLTNKRLTNPKLNEDVALTATATVLNALAAVGSDLVSWIQTLAGYGGATALTRNTAEQTLTNKTLTAPVIDGGSVIDATIQDPVITGAATLPSDTTIGDVSPTELSYLEGASSNLQAQINAITGGNIFYESVIEASTGSGITSLTWTKNEILDGASLSNLFNINYKSINCRAYAVDGTKNTQIASNNIEVNQSTGLNLSSVKISGLTQSTPHLFAFTFRLA